MTLPPGFIPHDGGPCPVDDVSVVCFITRNGNVTHGWKAKDIIWQYGAWIAEAYNTLPRPCEVTAYRPYLNQDEAHARIAELEAALSATKGRMLNISIGLSTGDTKAKAIDELQAAIALIRKETPHD